MKSYQIIFSLFFISSCLLFSCSKEKRTAVACFEIPEGDFYPKAPILISNCATNSENERFTTSDDQFKTVQGEDVEFTFETPGT